MQPRTSALSLVFALVVVAFAAACAPDRSGTGPAQTRLDEDSGVDDGAHPFDASSGDDYVDFDGSSDDDSGALRDARAAPPFDAGPNGVCAQPLALGDLAIVELMISSIAGSGDHGEWIEVRSALDCALSLRGLRGECAVGGTVHSFDVIDDVWIMPRGTFVVADSIVPAVDHDLPGVVIAWDGRAGDVLRNLGSTITLRLGGAIIDSVTYPALKLEVGVSFAFPHDCTMSARADFASWRASTASWFPGFAGTPNAPNIDVHCP